MFSRSKKKKSDVQPKPEVKAGAKRPAKAEGNQAKPSAEEIAKVQQRAAKSKQLQASFGEIVGLLMRSPQYKSMPLASLEELVVPAITSGQFVIAEAQAKKSGLITHVAAILWASVSEEIDRRLSDNGGEPVKLAPKDWKSGDIPWLIIAAGDQRLIKALAQRIQETTLKGRPLKFRSADKVDEDVAPTVPPN